MLFYCQGFQSNIRISKGYKHFFALRILCGLSGGLLFSGLTALQVFFQAIFVDIIPAFILKTLPYLLSITVLVLVTSSAKHRRSTSPADLAVPFSRES